MHEEPHMLCMHIPSFSFVKDVPLTSDIGDTTVIIVNKHHCFHYEL